MNRLGGVFLCGSYASMRFVSQTLASMRFASQTLVSMILVSMTLGSMIFLCLLVPSTVMGEEVGEVAQDVTEEVIGEEVVGDVTGESVDEEATEAKVNILIVPFEVHSSVDISGERRAILEVIAQSTASQGIGIAGLGLLEKEFVDLGKTHLTDKEAQVLAFKAGADFIINGSISMLDKSINVDWRLVDTGSGKVLKHFYKASSDEESLLVDLKVSAGGIYKTLLSFGEIKPDIEKDAIARLAVEGNKRVGSEAIFKKIKSKEGEVFSPDVVREDIESIYAMNYFEDVQVDLTETGFGKELTFIVKEKLFVKKVKIEGLDEISNEDLETIVTVKEGTTLNRVTVKEDSERIKEFARSEGLYLAEVKALIETEGIYATVIYDVNEGSKVKTKRINIIGNEVYSDKALKKVMVSTEKGFWSFLTGSGKFNEYFLEGDKSFILNKYFENGYIKADIIDISAFLSQDKKWFYIDVVVDEGSQFLVGTVGVEGDILEDSSSGELVDLLRLEEGEVFNRSKFSEGMERVQDLYKDRGFANVDLRPQTSINGQADSVDIVLGIDQGSPVFIERIDISGNVKTKDKVLRREFFISEGELYSSTKLKDSMNSLRRLGYFADVKFVETQGSSKEKLKLDVDVQERPTGSLSLGIGYSTADKIIGTASVSQNNFFGTGIKTSLSATASDRSDSYSLSVTDPWIFDKPVSAGFDLFNTTKEYEDFTMEKSGGGVRFGVPFFSRKSRLTIGYKLEDVTVYDVEPTAAEAILDQEGETRVSSIITSIRRDTRNDAFFPTEGYKINLTNEYAGGRVGGDTNFIKTDFSAIKFFNYKEKYIFALRAAGGYVNSFGLDKFGEPELVPIYERYFKGGMNSVRGYNSRSLSPLDPATGNLIGGESNFVLNAEFIFPLGDSKSFRGVIFYDTGNAFDGGVEWKEMRSGAGGGIRWLSPMGPLRFEWGYNLDKRLGERQAMWEIAIGSSF